MHHYNHINLTLTWTLSWSFKFNLTFGVICSMWVIIYFNPTFYSKFRWLIWCIILTIYLFFDIPLLYYYISLRSLIIFNPFSGDTYLCLGVFLPRLIFSVSFVTVSKLFCGKIIRTLFILPVIVLPIESPHCFYYFLNYSFSSSFKCICSRFFSMIQN